MLKERSLKSLSIYICFMFFFLIINALTVNLPLSLSYPEEDIDEMSPELQQLQGSTTDSSAGVKDFYERGWNFNIKNVNMIVWKQEFHSWKTAWCSLLQL